MRWNIAQRQSALLSFSLKLGSPELTTDCNSGERQTLAQRGTTTRLSRGHCVIGAHAQHLAQLRQRAHLRPVAARLQPPQQLAHLALLCGSAVGVLKRQCTRTRVCGCGRAHGRVDD